MISLQIGVACIYLVFVRLANLIFKTYLGLKVDPIHLCGSALFAVGRSCL